MVPPAKGEISIAENNDYSFTCSPYTRTSFISLNNTVDLDSSLHEDSSFYLAEYYSLEFDLNYKKEGPHLSATLARYAPWYYDAPILTNHPIQTSVGPMDAYRGKELLPELNEYWMEIPLFQTHLRLKTGLFKHDVGNGLALGTDYYENYGAALSLEGEIFKPGFYYFRPDLAHKNPLGPRMSPNVEQGIDFESTEANFFSFDCPIVLSNHTLQPYIGLLIDQTAPDKRSNGFSTPTDKDTLGTIGIAWKYEHGKWSMSVEIARNFGEAQSLDPAYPDVVHKGYLVYSSTSYTIEPWTGRLRFILASGNKVNPAQISQADSSLSAGKDTSFNVYSPLNGNLSDALTTNPDFSPVVAMGWGYGLNYGINRPSTSYDPSIFENLIMPSLGLDYQPIESLTLSLDGWYLAAMEKGYGTLEGDVISLSRDLGYEIDLTAALNLNSFITLTFTSGFFFPGQFYMEERDDIEGSLLTPFVRGDGHADMAYQIELVLEVKF